MSCIHHYRQLCVNRSYCGDSLETGGLAFHASEQTPSIGLPHPSDQTPSTGLPHPSDQTPSTVYHILPSRRKMPESDARSVASDLVCVTSVTFFTVSANV